MRLRSNLHLPFLPVGDFFFHSIVPLLHHRKTFLAKYFKLLQFTSTKIPLDSIFFLANTNFKSYLVLFDSYFLLDPYSKTCRTRITLYIWKTSTHESLCMRFVLGILSTDGCCRRMTSFTALTTPGRSVWHKISYRKYSEKRFWWWVFIMRQRTTQWSFPLIQPFVVKLTQLAQFNKTTDAC